MMFFRDKGSMHGSLIVGIESRLCLIEDKLSDVDARASEEADCNANERDMDRFIFSGNDSILFFNSLIVVPKGFYHSRNAIISY